jgi:hypothetical protein
MGGSNRARAPVPGTFILPGEKVSFNTQNTYYCMRMAAAILARMVKECAVKYNLGKQQNVGRLRSK